jgi:GxxExxY protein
MEQEDSKTRRFCDCSEAVIGACIEVHRHLGPGLLESVYEECVARELALRGLRFERQVPVPLVYKGVDLACGYRIDILVEGALVLEIKAVEGLLRIHQAQVLTYLKLAKLRLGLLVNFRETLLKNGPRRMILFPRLREFEQEDTKTRRILGWAHA